MTDSEAKAAVNYYDLDGSGEMDYNVRHVRGGYITRRFLSGRSLLTVIGQGLVGDFDSDRRIAYYQGMYHTLT